MRYIFEENLEIVSSNMSNLVQTKFEELKLFI